MKIIPHCMHMESCRLCVENMNMHVHVLSVQSKPHRVYPVHVGVLSAYMCVYSYSSCDYITQTAVVVTF